MELLFRSWSLRLTCLLLTVWMSTLIEWTSGEVSINPDVITAAVGETVTLSVQHSGSIQYINWYRGTETDSDDQILGIVTGSLNIKGEKYTDRETGLPNGSLQIRDVLKNYTGNYTLQMQLNSGKLEEARAQLRVYETLVKPGLRFNNSHPVEYQDSIDVICRASLAAETILWIFNKSLILTSSNRINLSSQNSTLTIANVSRADSGIYECEAINPVSTSRSDPEPLTVAYGPQNVTIEPPGPHILKEGATITLTCTAESVPEIEYKWFHRDINVTIQRLLVLDRVSSNDEGNYTCVAHNTKTGQSANASTSITLHDSSISGGRGLKSEEIAGIVVGVLIAIILAGALVYFILAKRSVKSSTVDMNTSDTSCGKKKAATNANPSRSTEEIQYSTVSFVPKEGKPNVPKTGEDIIYSEVRR